MEILYAVPCEACLLREDDTGAREGSSIHCRRNHWKKFLTWAKIQRILCLYPFQRERECSWKPTTPSCAPWVRQLILDETWYVGPPLRVLVCTHPHRLTVPVFLRLPRLPQKGEPYRSSWCDDQWRDTWVGSKLRIPFRVQPHSFYFIQYTMAYSPNTLRTYEVTVTF
jgi:hypothetical protein